MLSQRIVSAAVGKAQAADPQNVRETMGSGLGGVVDARKVCVGSHHSSMADARGVAARALRRASWRSALSVFVRSTGAPLVPCCLRMN